MLDEKPTYCSEFFFLDKSLLTSDIGRIIQELRKNTSLFVLFRSIPTQAFKFIIWPAEFQCSIGFILLLPSGQIWHWQSHFIRISKTIFVYVKTNYVFILLLVLLHISAFYIRHLQAKWKSFSRETDILFKVLQLFYSFC